MELSVVDATELAETIIKGDIIHFVAQVQTHGEIKYSATHKTGTYINLTDEANTTYTFQYKLNNTEKPYANFYRLHLKLNTGFLPPGVWYFVHHVELANGTWRESSRLPLSIRESDSAPIIEPITPHSDYEHTVNDEQVFSANITDPDGDRIVHVDLMVNGTNHTMANDGSIYTKYIGKLPHTVDFYKYFIHTTRKKDGDNNWTYNWTFPLIITEGIKTQNDTLPEVEDITNIPSKLSEDESIRFEVSYKDVEGDQPDKILVSIFNSSLDTLISSVTIHLKTGSIKEGATFERTVNLATEGISHGDWMYRIEYTYNGTDFLLAERDFKVIKETPDKTDNPVLIVLVILITIVILLALFVFTFGKRDPY
ncbi:MAG: hypothetical protein QGH39_11895 [Candidatus Thermoplasmatota archaeon]|jgi:hypothetical protein|nr:hypothetical protein [Candidatus Thermoplasmatota archaeon]